MKNKSFISLLALVGITVGFSGCSFSCTADPAAFVLLPRTPIPPDNTLSAPSTFEIGAPATYTIQSRAGGPFSCPTFTPVEVKGVTFYNNGTVIGTDDAAPFILSWQLVPGKDGVPASGSGQIKLYAIASDGTRTADWPLTVVVK